MSRAQAAALLGVVADADADQVRRAWRAWARLTHPDHGGDREFFEQLRQARDVLVDSGTDTSTGPDHSVDVPSTEPSARLPWSQVLRRPGVLELAVLSSLAVLAIALVAIVDAVGTTSTPLMLAIAAGPAAVAAAGWAHIVVSRLLAPGGDVAHRITALTMAWLPIVSAQITLAQILGVSLVGVLPVMVLPFVVIVAAVNPGAGLWRNHPRRAHP